MPSQKQLQAELFVAEEEVSELEKKLAAARIRRDEAKCEVKTLSDALSKANPRMRDCLREILGRFKEDRPMLAAINAVEEARAQAAEAAEAEGAKEAAPEAAAIERHLEAIEKADKADPLEQQLEAESDADAKAQAKVKKAKTSPGISAGIDARIGQALYRNKELAGNLRNLGAGGKPVEDDAIAKMICSYWPKGREFIPKEQGGGPGGFTYSANGTYPVIWIGAFKGIGHEADYGRPAIVKAARQLFNLKAREQIAAEAQAGEQIAAQIFAKQGKFKTPGSVVHKPPNGWTRTELDKAARILKEKDASALEVCLGCECARHWEDIDDPCPKCGDANTAGAVVWLVKQKKAEKAAAKPKAAEEAAAAGKRGRGRPPGAKNKPKQAANSASSATPPP